MSTALKLVLKQPVENVQSVDLQISTDRVRCAGCKLSDRQNEKWLPITRFVSAVGDGM